MLYVEDSWIHHQRGIFCKKREARDFYWQIFKILDNYINVYNFKKKISLIFLVLNILARCAFLELFVLKALVLLSLERIVRYIHIKNMILISRSFLVHSLAYIAVSTVKVWQQSAS